MKREWYIYAPTTDKVWADEIRRRLPESLQERLLRDRQISSGVAADPTDMQLVEELDRILLIGRNKGVMRSLHAEVDRRSVSDYEYYMLAFPKLEPIFETGNPRDVVVPTGREFARRVSFSWPRGVQLGIRELANGLIESERQIRPDQWILFEDRIILLSDGVKDVLQRAEIRGVEYLPLSTGYWMMEVLQRVPCRADEVELRKGDYDAATRSVGMTYEFGLRYELADLGPEDLQIVDRVEVGNTSYRYRYPRLVASRRFVQVCLAYRVDRMKFANVLFGHGLVPALIGRGRITSTLRKYM